MSEQIKKGQRLILGYSVDMEHKHMKRSIQILTAAVITCAISTVLVGCNDPQGTPTVSDHPSGDHPKADHPSGEHPKADHPKADHPSGS